MHTHTEHSLVQWEDRLQITQRCQLVNKQGKKNLQIAAKQNASQNVCCFLYLKNVITDTVKHPTKRAREYPVTPHIGKYMSIYNT